MKAASRSPLDIAEARPLIKRPGFWECLNCIGQAAKKPGV